MAIITASPKNLQRLIELQEMSNEHLATMRNVLETSRLIEMEQLLQAKRDDEGNIKLEKGTEKQLDTSKEILKVNKEQLKAQVEAAENAKQLKEQLEAVEKVADAVKGFKSIGERFKDFGSNIMSKFTLGNMKKSMLQSVNVGGVLDKKLARDEFIKSRKDSGDTRSNQELAESFDQRNSAKVELDKNEKILASARLAHPGKSDEEIRKVVTPDSKYGQAFAQKDKLLTEFAKHDAINSGENPEVKPIPVEIKKDTAIPTNPEQNDDFNDSETEMENARARDEQTDLLKKIEENTGGKPGEIKPVASEEVGGKTGGILSGIGSGLSKLGDAAKSMLMIGAALWVVSKAFANFAELDWEGFSKGIIALGSLTLAVMALGQGGPSMIAGSAAMLIMGGALWVIGESLNKFAELDWETIGKGLLAVVGLGAVGVALGAFAPMAILGAGAMVALGAGLWVIGEAMQAVGEGFKQMTEGLTTLSEMDGENLLKVGAGLAAIGAGMAVFGAGTAAAGIGNLVGGFLNLITPGKSPVEQILELGKSGEGIEKAGVGVEKLAQGLSAFSNIDTDKIKAIAELPTEKIAAMGAAMSNNANQVYNKSGDNALAAGSGGNVSNTTTVVNAPVNNTTKQNQIIKSPVRNADSTINRYVTSRY